MTESNNETNSPSVPQQATAADARLAAARATAPVGHAAQKAAAGTDQAMSAARSGTARATEATSAAAHTAARGVEQGRQVLITASGQVAATAKTAWAAVSQRKLAATGAAAGLTAISAASYALGRRAERGTQGPLTRITQGRI
ncbi:hypothetical protein KUM39_07155 [Streptomyces sp. J2-1]|uniref:hypothetical protein n=1 Tax=Streptomyces corallincola TaxID=2851888 RepID=UPI001C38EFC5|nr:hypothetical protein [Streptomyces corallincola]MBV2354143.1 hypothetical protein [Streptomyces corallincola]